MDIKRHFGECEAAQSVSHYGGEEVCVFGLNWRVRLLIFFKVRGATNARVTTSLGTKPCVI